MKNTFEYMFENVAQDMITIGEVGEVALDMFNDDGYEWMLSAHTRYGVTKLITIGPMIADIDVIPNNFQFTYQYDSYDENKISKIIKNELNNPRRSITQVVEISQEEFRERLNNLVEEEMD